MNETEKRENRRKFLEGVVISDKMQKTRVVQVKWTSKHSKYYKIMKRASKYKVHDEKNQAKTGDIVRIMETRPISKEKRWTIVEVTSTCAKGASASLGAESLGTKSG